MGEDLVDPRAPLVEEYERALAELRQEMGPITTRRQKRELRRRERKLRRRHLGYPPWIANWMRRSRN